MFKTRLLSGIVLLAGIILMTEAGGPVMLCILAALSVIGLFELYRAVGIVKAGKDGREHISALGAAGAACGVFWYTVLAIAPAEYHLPYFAVVFTVFLVIYVLGYPRYETADLFAAFAGMFYLCVLLSCIYLTRTGAGGKHAAYMIFIAAWGSDTCAYCVGMLIGKHKMTPRLSPKKSWEGAVGGVLGAALLGFLYALAFGQPRAEYAVIAAAGAVLSVFGDLAASAIKRKYGIKDFGTMIPGHGGVLDRFDSILVTAPVICLLSMVLL